MDEGVLPAASESQKRTCLTGAAIFFLSGLCFRLVLINDDWIDLSLYLRLGERVADGEVPHRDFFMAIWPGTPCLMALWFKVFGTSMDGVRILQAAAGATWVLLAWLIARRLIKGPLLWIAPFGALACYVVGNEGIGHMTFASLFVLAAILAAVHADASGRKRGWFVAGAMAALSGTFMQTLGVWAGFALVLAALTGAKGTRLRGATATMGGAAAVLVPMAALLAALGAFSAFFHDSLFWLFERYQPFHAGVGWGSWLPQWSMLNNIPHAWWFVWVPALAVIWAGVYLFPLLPVGSGVRWLLCRDERSARRILWMVCVAGYLAAYPHIGAMRVARLLTPLWILLAFELYALFRREEGKVSLMPGVEHLLAAAVCLALLLIAPLQLSYRQQLIELDSSRGSVLVREAAHDEYEILHKTFALGDEVLILPEYGTSGYLMGFKNPTRFEKLLPVIFTREQIREAAGDLERRGYPPVVLMTARDLYDAQTILRNYKPSKYVDEFESNPMKECLSAHYDLVLQEGPVAIFKAKKNK